MINTATNAIAVDVKTEQGWVAFSTIKEAAAYLRVSHSYLTTCLRHERKCNGQEVRHHQDDDVILNRQRQAYMESCREFDKKLMDWFETHPTRSLSPNLQKSPVEIPSAR